MKKSYKLINFLCFLCLFSNMISLEISGKISDSKKNPISKVIVSSQDKVALSNHRGYYRITVSDSTRMINFQKIGFKKISSDVKKLLQNGNIEMTLKPVELSEVSIVEKQFSSQKINSPEKIVIKVDKNLSETKDAAELIENNSSLHVSGNPLLGESKKVSILGHRSSHTLVMIDGIPMNMSGSDFDVSSIPSSIISEIEIIKSSSSAISGSGSIAGIINIITKDEDEKDKLMDQFSLVSNQQFGSFGLCNSNIHASINKKVKSFISLSRNYSKNNFKFKKMHSDDWVRRKNNEKLIWDALLSFESNFRKINWKYTFSYQDYYKELPGPINSISIYDKCNVEGDTQRHIANLKNPFIFGELLTDFYYFKEYSEFDNTESSGHYKIKSFTDFSKRGLKLTNHIESKPFTLNYGYDLFREDFEYKQENSSINSVPPVYLTNQSLFISSNVNQYLNRFMVNLDTSVRQDYISRSDTLNYKNYFSWKGLIEVGNDDLFSLKVGSGIGTGYKVPSFYDLHWKGDSQAIGNPELIPEESLGWQIYAKISYLSFLSKITYYRNEIDNMIFWHRSLTGWKPDNIAKAEISNFEIEAGWNPLSFMSQQFSWIRTDSKDKTKDLPSYNRPLIYTPTSKTNLQTKFYYNKTSFLFRYSRTGDQFPYTDSNNKVMKAYEIWDCELNSGVDFWDWEVSTFVDFNNVFNQYYDSFLLTPKPGFNWSAGININLKK